MIIFALTIFRGYGEIGRHARLRIWCRKACRFESYYPHKTKCNSLIFRELHFFIFQKHKNTFQHPFCPAFTFISLALKGLREDIGSIRARVEE